MKPAYFYTTALGLTLAAALATGCGKLGGDADDQPAAHAASAGEPAEPGVVLDADTQARIGLKMAAPQAADWQPVLHATGMVANPLDLMQAVTDLESARTTATASQAELERTQTLAGQGNASPRVLAAAQAAAAHDALALTAAEAKFAANWGAGLAAQTNLTAKAEQLRAGNGSLVKVLLPAGTFPQPLPATAVIAVFNDEPRQVAATLAGRVNIDPSSQVETLLYETATPLPADAAVTADLALDGHATHGLLIPADAVLRYEGKGWVYVQAATNRFEREEVPLDRLMTGGWFYSGDDVTAASRIVVTGADTVLSAELSAGGFNTGQRD